MSKPLPDYWTEMEERLAGEGRQPYKAAVLQRLDAMESRLRASMATRLVPDAYAGHLAAVHAVECARKFLEGWEVPPETGAGLPSPASVTEC